MARMVVDEIVTTYTMDPDGYLRGVKKIKEVNQDLIKSHNLMERGNHMLTSGLQLGANGVKTAIGAVAIAGSGLLATITGLGAKSISSAVEFDTLSRKLEAVAGSAERAKVIMGFIDELAIPSVFETKPLAEAATVLEAFGLSTERFLPIAEKLGTVFGGTEESLQSFVSALGYLKGQRFGEGFESLSRAGISRELLQSKGLKFDKGGSYLGSTEEALNAVESLVNERFGSVAKKMADGPAAKWASLMDGFNRSLRQFGTAGLEVALPVISSISDKLTNLVKSGVIEKVGKSFFGIFGGVNFEGGITKAISYFLAALKTAPSLVNIIKSSFDGLLRSIQAAVSIMVAAYVAGPVVSGVIKLVEVSKALAFAWAGGASAAQAFAIAVSSIDPKTALRTIAVLAAGGLIAVGTYKQLSAQIEKANHAVTNPKGALSDFWKSQQEIESGMNKKSATGALNDVIRVLENKIGGDASKPDKGDASIPYLRQIQENTDPLKQWSDQVLGGGAMARHAINRQDMSDLRTGRSSGRAKWEDKVLDGIREGIAVGAISINNRPRREA